MTTLLNHTPSSFHPTPSTDNPLVAAPPASESPDALTAEDHTQHSTDTLLPADVNSISLAEAASAGLNASSNAAKEFIDTPRDTTADDGAVGEKHSIVTHIKDATVDSGTTVVSVASDATAALGGSDVGDILKEQVEEGVSNTNAEDSRDSSTLGEAAVIPTSAGEANSVLTMEVVKGEPASSGLLVQDGPAVSTVEEAEVPSTEQEVTQKASGELNEFIQAELSGTPDHPPPKLNESGVNIEKPTKVGGGEETPVKAEENPIVKETVDSSAEEEAKIIVEKAEAGSRMDEVDDNYNKEEDTASVAGASIKVEVVAPTPALVDKRILGEGLDPEDAVDAESLVAGSLAADTGKNEELTPEGAITPKAGFKASEPNIMVQGQAGNAEASSVDIHTEDLEEVNPAQVDAHAQVSEELAIGAIPVAEDLSELEESALGTKPATEEQVTLAEGSTAEEMTEVIETAEYKGEPVPMEEHISASRLDGQDVPPAEEASVVTVGLSVNDWSSTAQGPLAIGDESQPTDKESPADINVEADPNIEESPIAKDVLVVKPQLTVEPTSEIGSVEPLATERVVEDGVIRKSFIEEAVPVDAPAIPGLKEGLAEEPVAENDVGIEPLVDPEAEGAAANGAVLEEEAFAQQETKEVSVAQEQVAPKSEVTVQMPSTAEEHVFQTVVEPTIKNEIASIQEKPSESTADGGTAIETIQVESQPKVSLEPRPEAADELAMDEVPSVEQVAHSEPEPVTNVPAVEDVVVGHVVEDQPSVENVDNDVPVPELVAETPVGGEEASQHVSALEDGPAVGHRSSIEEASSTTESSTINPVSEGVSIVAAKPAEGPVGGTFTSEERTIEEELVATEEHAAQIDEEMDVSNDQSVENVADERVVTAGDPSDSGTAEEQPEEHVEIVEIPASTEQPIDGIAEVDSTDIAEQFAIEGVPEVLPTIKQEPDVVRDQPVLQADTTVQTNQSFAEHNTYPEKPTLGIPSVVEEASRQEWTKSPWTPSFQVTTIGHGKPLPAEEDIPPEPLDDTEVIATDSLIMQPAIVIEDKSAGDPRSTDSAELPAKDVGVIEPSSLAWTPSYSVHSQGSPSPTHASIEDKAPQEETVSQVAETESISALVEVVTNPTPLPSEPQTSEVSSPPHEPETESTVAPLILEPPESLNEVHEVRQNETHILPKPTPSGDAEFLKGVQSTGPILSEDPEPSVFSPAGMIGVGVVGGPMAALAASSLIGRSNGTNRATSPESKTPQNTVFPTIEIPAEEELMKSNVGSLPPVDENNALDTTSNHPSSPLSSRKRLESTTSSRRFPGGWFSNTSKIPNGRTSHEVAQGEFTGVNKQGATGEETIASPTSDPITPTREHSSADKRKWCIIM